MLGELSRLGRLISHTQQAVRAHRGLLSREYCQWIVTLDRPHPKSEGLGAQELGGREEICEYPKLYANVCVCVIFG